MPSIPQRRLGRSGPLVSALGLGCMPMSWTYGSGHADADSEATIHRALDLGVTFFDTADMYGAGHNEILLGHALRGRREQAVIATKFGNMMGIDGSFQGINGRPEYARAACEMSLRRLGIETIDLYYLHRVDPEVPIEESVGAMAELVKQGKVRHVGLSEAAPETIRRAHRVHPIGALQSEYSLWTRDPEAAVLPVCRELGIAFVAFSPLGRGLFTGTVRRAEFEAQDFRRQNPRFQAANLEQNLNLADQLANVAKAKGCTSGQLALAWLLTQGDDIIPIPGTRRQKHLEENVAAATLRLTPAEAAAIAAAVPAEAVAGHRYTPEQMRRVGL